MTEQFIRDLFEGFKEVYDELSGAESEFDFRYSLVKNIFENILNWSRKEGEGNYRIEKERKDIVFYDDSDPPLPVIIVETKKSSHKLDLSDYDQLKGYMQEVGSAEYGILTNGKKLIVYQFSSEKEDLKNIMEMDIEQMIAKEELTDKEVKNLTQLSYFSKERFVKKSDFEVFENQKGKIKIKYERGISEIGYEQFLNSLRLSLEDLTNVLREFFDVYQERQSYSGRFLRASYDDWRVWRAFTGRDDNPQEYFCKETAYMILNRILFTRICEDKLIVNYSYLSGKGIIKILEEVQDYQYLEALNRAYNTIEGFYKHLYQLNVFDWWIVKKDERDFMDDDSLETQKRLEEELNYVVGKTLKRLNVFDFKNVNRDILGRVYEEYLSKEERKKLGEFYTPIEIVNYILDYVGFSPERDIGDKKIIDPACGSGTFLTEIVERIIRYYLQKFNKLFADELDSDEAKIVMDTILENVYGMDINPFAIHISEMNLLFRIIDLYQTIMVKHKNYNIKKFKIYCTDTLLSEDIGEESVSLPEEHQRTLSDFSDNGRAKLFAQELKESEKIKKEIKFDYVVGNPPYVRIQNLGDVRETYNTSYKTAYRNYDIYVLFIERGLNWLKERGRLGYINPNRFLNSFYGEKLRELLLDYRIKQIINFTDTEVFDTSTPYPIILIAEKSPSGGNMIKCARIAEGYEDLMDDIRKNIESRYYRDELNRFDVFECPQDELTEDFWLIMPEGEREVFDKIKGFPKLDDYDDIFVGLQTSADQVYILDYLEDFGDELKVYSKSRKKEVILENNILKPLLKGDEIHKWLINEYNKLLLFPYLPEDSGAKVIEPEVIESNYPKTWDYLNENREKLEIKRENGKLKGKPNWYKYIYEKNHEKFEKIKIMTPVLAKNNKFVFDSEGKYYFVGGGNAGGYGIILNEENKNESDYLYFTALLNSKVLEYFHKHVSVLFGGKYYSYSQRYLEHFPIVVSESESVKSEVIEKAKRIIEALKDANEIEKRTENFSNYIPEKTEKIKLIDLAENIQIKKELLKLDNLRLKTAKTVNNELEYVLTVKKGNWVSFNDDKVAEFVKSLLNQREKISKSDLINLNIPQKEVMKKSIEGIEKDKTEIEKLGREAQEIQIQLDNLIAKEIYELDENDIAVIDEFLEVW